MAASSSIPNWASTAVAASGESGFRLTAAGMRKTKLTDSGGMGSVSAMAMIAAFAVEGRLRTAARSCHFRGIVGAAVEVVDDQEQRIVLQAGREHFFREQAGHLPPADGLAVGDLGEVEILFRAQRTDEAAQQPRLPPRRRVDEEDAHLPLRLEFVFETGRDSGLR